ncbi:MAG: VWA domain-containing protein [Euryarchaeota archaeon]|nr:VWA domain-containing protein [Euryarchaeota archaeon]
MQFEHPYFLFFVVPSLLMFYYFKRKRALLLSRFTIVVMVLLAAAGPFETRGSIVEGDARISILVDNSSSMELYGVPGRIPNATYFSSGSRTALGDAAFQGIAAGGDVLIFSDGSNNYGRELADVAMIARRINATISAVALTPEKNDVGVRIEGNKKVLLDSENEYRIIVEKVGSDSSYVLEVSVDGRAVLSQNVVQKEKIKTIPFKHAFNSGGAHEIEARITVHDHFAENNVFYKSVYVVPKPRILLVSERDSPLAKVLSEIYDVEISNLRNLKNYAAVFLDDIPASKLSKEDVALLREYVAEGNGLVVVGGSNSYEKGGYRDSLLETLLPVKSIKSQTIGKGIGVVIAIDISGSTQALFGEATKADVEKAIAVGLLRDLNKEDFLGVVAFNSDSYIVAPFDMYPDRKEVEEKVARLRFGGGTIVYSAQIMADIMLSNFSGSRNFILISDGVTAYPEVSLERAKSTAARGIRTYAVGVGYDTNEAFMQQLTSAGNGLYFKPEEYQRLKIVFGEEEIEEREAYPLAIITKNHFITQNVALNASVYGFNEVTAKTNAQLLAAAGGSPAVTAWRFGLGRVVSLTTDSGAKWSSQLYSGENSKLISAIANWAIGDPEKGRETKIDVEDVRLGEALNIAATSSKPPKISMNGAQLRAAASGVNLYHATFTPDKPGFYRITANSYADVVAVNYPVEFMNMGFNEELLRIAEATGGRVYSPNENYLEEITRLAKARTRRTVVEKVDLSLPFLIAAFALFFFEVAVRRIREIRRGAKKFK